MSLCIITDTVSKTKLAYLTQEIKERFKITFMANGKRKIRVYVFLKLMAVDANIKLRKLS